MATRQTIGFESFELDLARHELRRDGQPVALQNLPLKLLILLVEADGRLVTRDEIAAHLWGPDVFHDTEHGINTAIRKIRAALGDDPDQPRIVLTVPAMGYRFVAQTVQSTPLKLQAVNPGHTVEVESVIGESAPPASGEGLVATTRAAGSPKFVFIVMAVLILLAVGIWLLRPKVETSAAARKIKIAVLPFENLSGDSDQEYFSDGLTEELLTDLGSVDPGQLGVIARSSVMRYKHSTRPIDEIARQLGNVDYVLEGSVRRDGQRVRISAQLIRARDQEHVWARNYDYDLADILTLQAAVSQAIADEIRLQLTPERQARLKERRTVNPVAYEAYLRGRSAWSKDADPSVCSQAQTYFEKAIAADENYAPAYSGLADYYILCGGLYELLDHASASQASQRAALKAVSLSPSLAAAHNSLAAFQFTMQWDCSAAERESQLTVSLDPNLAEGHGLYALILASCGNPARAVEEGRKAHELDPVSRSGGLAHLYYRVRKFDLASAEAERELAIDSNSSTLRWLLFRISLAQGKYQDSVEHLRQAMTLDGDAEGAAELARLYRGGNMQAVLQRLAVQTRSSPGQTPMQIAEAYALAGDRAQALEWLSRAYQRHSARLIWIRTYPAFDFLGDDPAFQDLLRRVGVAPNGC